MKHPRPWYKTVGLALYYFPIVIWASLEYWVKGLWFKIFHAHKFKQ